jgi:hypothetical protein
MRERRGRAVHRDDGMKHTTKEHLSDDSLQQGGIMRKLTVLGAGIAMLAMLAGVAGATHSPGQGPKHDFAAGTLHGTVQFGGADATVDIHVNAKSGPLGQNAQGQMFVRISSPTQPEVELRGEVTCLNVVGNLATAGGRLERAENFPGGFQTLIVSVQDFGEPGGGPTTPDTFNAQVELTPPPTTCPVLPAAFPSTEGNVVVHDAQ